MELYDLPDGWEWEQLSTFVECLESGNRPRGGVSKYTSGVPSISAEQISNQGRFIWNSIKYVPQIFYEQAKKGHIKKNDILIVKDGATTGKCALVDDDFPFEKAMINEHTFIFRPNLFLNSKFAFYYLISPLCKDYFDAARQRGVIGGITNSFPTELTIPILPVPEQERIVARIEKLTSRVEEARRLRQEAIEEINHYIPVTYQTVYRNLIEECQTIPLGKTGKVIGGGTPSRKNAEFWKGSIPWIAPKEMKTWRIKDSSENINETAIQQSSAKLIQSPAVLFVVRGMILARNVPVAISKQPLAINQDMKAIIPKEGINVEFLASMVKGAEDILLGKVEVAGHGTRKLETNRWSNLPIPVPNEKKQCEIVEYLSSIQSKAEALKRLQTETEAELATFTPALLAKAFGGEL